MYNEKSIAVVSFGTTYLNTAQKTIHAVEKDIAESFKDYNVVSAYTSGMVISRLSKMGVKVSTLDECFENLSNCGTRDLIVLPTHVISGEEYFKVVECSKRFSSKFNSINVCRPLIQVQDIENIVDNILKTFKVSTNEFLVFMGHGSSTEANQIYDLINLELSNRGVKNIYISTVEAKPELSNALIKVKEYNPKKVILTPFMLVSGDHANNDMAIEWKSAFENLGFTTECILKGLGEYPNFRKIYVDRVREKLC